MTSLHKIVLDDDLFVVYQKVIAGEEADTRKVRALLGAIQMDVAMDGSQIKRCMVNLPENFRTSSLVVKLLRNNIEEKSLETLAQESIHKLILTYDESNVGKPYYYLIKSQNPFTTSYTWTCKAGDSRESLIEHLQHLCKDASEILLRDRYLAKVPYIYKFIPDKELVIYCTESAKGMLIRNAIKKHSSSSKKWDLRLDKKADFKRGNIHDRYLHITYLTHKYEVILSSGFEYLFSSDKELTCIFRELQ
ncbi:hypothetical protein [Bilophila wadsworthia]|uniref:hypothetical protein n=1 Tax=Bilophila wadsworthia TaxID=35833 RepID=UPI00241EB2FD|nr:hypothetical protein [Bilophila wadsworthia]